MKSFTAGIFLAVFTVAWGIGRAGMADGSAWENNGALNGPYGALGTPGPSGGEGGLGDDAGAAAEITETSAVNGISGTATGGNGGTGGAGGGPNGLGDGGDGGYGGSGGMGISDSGLQITNAGMIGGGVGGVGGNGGSGDSGNGGNGGNGGSGGTGVVGSGLQVTNAGAISGGNGGNGGWGGDAVGGTIVGSDGFSGYGGAGGSGGAGVVGSGLQITNAGAINGGDGGDGGGGGSGSVVGPGADGDGGDGGAGGSGGAGVVGSGLQITNSGTISGGSGGFGGVAGSGAGGGTYGSGGAGGSGGVGVSGSNLVLTDSGTISGGLAAYGETRADAVEFTGGVNSLILESGYSIVGVVAAYSPGDSLILGGSGDAAFDASGLGASGSGAQYQGFGSYEVDASEGAVWTLNGVAPVAVPWIVESGTLEVGDGADPSAFVPGSVAVEPGGTLTGYGAVGGVVNDGVVAPGDGPGTLTVDGNYQQNSGGTLRIELSPSQASRLTVEGTASLAGSLDLVAEPGVYGHKTYTILSAADGVSGAFSGVEGGYSTGFEPALTYAPDDVDLTLDAIVPTDATVYTALDSEALLLAQQTNNALLNRLDGLAGPASAPEPALLASLGAGSGLAQTGLSQGEEQGLDRLLPLLPDGQGKLGGWVRAVDTQDHLDGSNAAPGYTAGTGGFMAGVDGRLAKDFVGGVAVDDEQTNLEQGDGESGTLSIPGASLYGSLGVGPVRLDGTLGGAWDGITASRPTPLDEDVTSNHGGFQAQGALQAGLPLSVKGVDLFPKAGVSYADLSEGGFNESGVPGFDLDVAPQNTDSLKPYVGVGASKAWRVGAWELSPEADLGYSQELLETQTQDTVSVGGGTFTEQGVTPSLEQGSVGGGLGAAWGWRLALYADYHAVLGSNLVEQVVSGGLRWRFGGGLGAR